jgi:hypothetical protein
LTNSRSRSICCIREQSPAGSGNSLRHAPHRQRRPISPGSPHRTSGIDSQTERALPRRVRRSPPIQGNTPFTRTARPRSA